MPRFLSRLLLLAPVVSLLRWLSRRLDALLAADFERRFLEGPADPARVDALEETVRRTFRVASAKEKQRFERWFLDHARADQHTVSYAEHVFEWQRREIEARRPLAGSRILELGPGHSLAAGLLLHAHGAARYTGADFFPIAGRSSELYRSLRRLLAERPLLLPHPDLARAREETLRRFDAAVDLSQDEASFTEGKVEWRCPVDAARLPFPDASFDVVISNAAFEHFLDPWTAARESARVLAPGGVGIHQIDLRDHRDFARPLDFLRFEEAAWRELNRDMLCYTNRLRLKDFERAFSQAGFAIDVMKTTDAAPVSAELRAALHANFRDRDDLEALGAFFVVRT